MDVHELVYIEVRMRGQGGSGRESGPYASGAEAEALLTKKGWVYQGPVFWVPKDGPNPHGFTAKIVPLRGLLDSPGSLLEPKVFEESLSRKSASS